MNITKEDIDNLNSVVKIEIGQNDYQVKVDEILKDYRKKAKLPGFRPGMVPFGMVKKMYGTSVKAEEINKLLSDSLYKFINEEKIEILGNPLPNDEKSPKVDIENQQDFEFYYDLGLAPDFHVNLSDKDKFTYYVIAPGDSLIDKNILEIRKRYGAVSQHEESGENDLLQGRFVELDEEGNIKEGGIMHASTISLEYVEDEVSKNSLIGVRKDQTVVLDPRKVSKGGADTAALLGIEQHVAEALNSKFQFKVETIYRMKPAELNQEFFDKVYGPGQVNSEDEFRQKMSEELSKALVNDSDRKLVNDIYETLMEKLKLSLPDDFLKRWLLAVNEQNLSAEQIDQEYENYAKGLKYQLIENKIIKENEIKVSDEEVLERAKQLIRHQLRQYGQTDIDDKELTETAHRLLGNKDEAKKVYEQLYDQKILDIFKNKLNLRNKEVSYDDFVKLASGKPSKSKLLEKVNNLINLKK